MVLIPRDVLLIGTGVVTTVAIGVSVNYIRRHWQRLAIADEETVENILEKDRLHEHLKIHLNDEIGSMDRFGSMQLVAGGYIGQAEANSCSDFMQLFTKLETKGKIKRGDYEFLVTKILQPAGYRHPDVTDFIWEIQRRINGTSVSTSRQPDVVGSLQTIQRGIEEIFDGVLLHTDEGRDTAVTFLSVATSYVGDAQIKLTEELGLANMPKFAAMEEVTKRCRYVFVLMTEDFKADALLRFKTQMCLDEFIEKNEYRVVPIWTESSGLVRYPRELKLLPGLKYHLLFVEGENKQLYHNIFIHGLQKLIDSGRKSILVRVGGEI